MRTISRGKGQYHNREDAERIATQLLEGLAISSGPKPGEAVTGKRAHERLADRIEHSNDTGGWLSNYATVMDITSDGSVISWQDIELGETSEDHSIFKALWQVELRRTDVVSFHMSQQLVSEHEMQAYRRKTAEHEALQYEQKLKKQEEEREKLVRIKHARRDARRCEICGRKIWFWTFAVARSPHYLFHKRCGKTHGERPINLSRGRHEI
jgi:hypothetical protein